MLSPIEIGAVATAGLGSITMLWGNIKGTFARLESLIIVKAKLSPEMSNDFMDYSWAHFKQSPFGIRIFDAGIFFIRSKNRLGRLAHESNGDFITFWNGTKPLFVSLVKEKDGRNSGYASISFIRGTFDLEKLMIDSANFHDESKHEKTDSSSRYYVRRCFGRKSKRESDDMEKPSSPKAIHGVSNGNSFKPLFYSKDDLGVPTSKQPMENLAYDIGVQEFYEEVSRWKNSKEWFQEKGLSWRFGAGLFGPPGCHAKGTGILMFDGSVKKVEEVVVGDELMGPDSKPRKVLELAKGVEPMLEVTPVKGEKFIVNYNHIFHLTPSGKNEVVRCPMNIRGGDILKNTSKQFPNRLKLTRTGVNFEEKNLVLDPYILGLWLGDGTSSKPELTNIDDVLIKEWESFAKNIGLSTHTHGINHRINGIKGGGKKNHFLETLRDLSVINNKHIPQQYKTGSEKQRLEILAGLIDTDGHLNNNNYEIIQKNEKLARDIVFISRSLGFGATIAKVHKTCQTGNGGWYFRIYISGDTDKIPVRLERKKCSPRKQIKKVLRTGFSLKILPPDEYFGFCLNGDHLYLTEDFTIHHNTGKTSLSRAIGQSLDMPIHSYDLTTMDNEELVNNWQNSLSEAPCIVLLEDVDRIFDENRQVKTSKDKSPLTLDCLLNCISGVQPSDGILVLVTANDVTKLDPALGVPDSTGKSTRPGRLDRAVYVGILTEQGRYKIANRILSDIPQYIEKTVKDGEGETGAQFEGRCSKLALQEYWGGFKSYGEIDMTQVTQAWVPGTNKSMDELRRGDAYN